MLFRQKLVDEVIAKIDPVVDDVRLMNGKNRIADRMWTIRNHPMAVDRYQDGCRGNELACNRLRVAERWRARSPFIEPEAVDLDVEKNSFHWNGQSLAKRRA